MPGKSTLHAPFLPHRCFYPDKFRLKLASREGLKWNSSPNSAIFNLRIMCGMKRVIVFALKDNDELIVCKNRVTTCIHIRLLFPALSVQGDPVKEDRPCGATKGLMPQIPDWDYLIRTLSEKFAPRIA